jgi:thiol-disulfide isomerase/thioredoxin
MLDTAMRPVSLYSVRADYTILFFWDTDCGFCKRETPKLKKFYEDQKDSLNIEVFGICADTSMKVMKNYIKEKELDWINVNGPRSLTGNYHDAYDVHSTPVMYVLDKEKNIVAKRILTDQIVEFIPRHRRQQQK